MPPKGKKKGPQQKGSQVKPAEAEGKRKEDRLDLQEVSGQIEQELKRDMQQELVRILGELDYNDIIEYLYTTSVINNEDRASVLEAVQELVADKNQALEIVNWLFDKMKAKYGGTVKKESASLGSGQGQQEQKQEKVEEVVPKKIVMNQEESIEQKEVAKKGNVFDRITKKRDNVQRKEDLEVLEGDTQGDKFKAGKRLRKDEGANQQEEAKRETIIDLSSHKNNIRGAQGEEEGGAAVEEKKKVRCRHWPNCKLGDDECSFVHPKEDCPYFPKCQFGEKCLMIHPDIQCKYGMSCNRPNCSYKHPKGRMNMNMMGMPGQMQKAMLMMMTSSMMGGRKPKNKTWVQKPEQDKEGQTKDNENNKEQNDDNEQKPNQLVSH